MHLTVEANHIEEASRGVCDSRASCHLLRYQRKTRNVTVE